MQLPLLNLLGIATSAVGAVQKAFGHGNATGDFDAELASAMAGKEGGKVNLAQSLLKNGQIDDEALKTLLEAPAGFLLFQFMTSLKEMGLQTSDIQRLVSGNGSQMSDDALKALLTQHGVGQKELAAIMSDEALKAEIKTQLGASIKTALEAQARRDGIDPAALLELAASDAQTIEELIKRLAPDAAAATQQTASGEALPAAQTAAQSPEGQMNLILGLIQKSMSNTTNEIRAMVGQILKSVTKGEAAAAAAPQTSESPETALSVAQMSDTAQNTLGITKEALRDLFFSADPTARQQAAEQATTQITAYLKANEGKPLSPEVKQTLSFLKSAMSETEFAGIDNALKLWTDGQEVAGLKMPVDREMYTALTRKLGESDAQSRFETQMKQVVDQLRQTLPSQMKDAGGQVTLKLHPPMLGKVDVSMTMSDGQLQATFKTDQLVTRDMLVQNMSMLKEALADQGIKATQFSVSLSYDQRQPHEGQNAWANHGKGGQGFGHGQGRGQENGNRAFRESESAVYAQANYTGLLDSGLDLFA